MKIFVSGTTGDLGPFRKAVAEQLRRFGIEAVEQTDFSADPRTLIDLLKDKVKGCDAAICLIGSVFGAAPPGSKRSYTQLEYDFAAEFGKKTFLLFPSPACRLDEAASLAAMARDTPEQREWQKRHAEAIRTGPQKYDQFDNEFDVRRLTAEAVFHISPEAAGGLVARTARTDFPTPLSLLFDDAIGTDNPLTLASLAGRALRFITLLAIHDSVVNRIFGRGRADRRELSPILARPQDPGHWRSLLGLACPKAEGGSDERFIKEFAGWDEKNTRHVDTIVQHHAAIRSGNFDEATKMVADVKNALRSVFQGLDFLERYALVAVTDVDRNQRECTLTVLRGLDPRPLSVTIDKRTVSPPAREQLYLLDIHRSRALLLTPSLQCWEEAGRPRVFGWNGLVSGGEDAGELESSRVAVLTSFDRKDERRIPQPNEVLSAWLGEELCDEAFGFRHPAGDVSRKEELLDGASWTKVRAAVLSSPGELVLAKRFRVAQSVIYRGLHADIFEATDIALDGEAGDATDRAPGLVVHLLRPESAQHEEVRAWFERRADCWRRTAHPAVLRLSDAGDPAGKEGQHFLLTERVPGARSLEQVRRSGEPLSDRLLRRVVVLAAEVCRAAHAQGILLFALPPRHFLIGAEETVFVTGFESARATLGAEVAPGSLGSLARFSKDVTWMAPEFSSEGSRLAPTIDVFAVGRLLAELRGFPANASDVLAPGDWTDPWRCLAYHCLARDANVRFQSADHIIRFLDEMVPDTGVSFIPPRTVPVDATDGKPGFAMGKYPVTNAEYKRFCLAKGYPEPRHVSARADDPWSGLFHRLSGPWLPVTHVSLLDAQGYCEWMRKETRKRWRLPTESEWLRAAAGPMNALYPWGSEEPDRSRSNWGPYYRGPTVVGGFARGRSHVDCWDMAGNVWEWCTDTVVTGAPRRVVKGGAYDYSADALQLPSRDARLVTCRSAHVGFRVLCEDTP